MSYMKRLEEARNAFSKRDKKAAAAAHDPSRIASAVHDTPEEHGGMGSQYIGDFIYGGLDGIITTFAVVSGVAGADLGTGIILILGLANLLADGFSMATGAYLSTKSEQEYYDKEREREQWEVEHFLEGEITELKEIYLSKGYTREETDQLLTIIGRDTERLVDAMMVDELGLMRDDRNPYTSGLVTFAAFLIAGIVPLITYLLGLAISIPSQFSFPIAIGLSGLALIALGAGKVLVTRQNPFKSGLEMLFVGGLAATVAYGVGAILKGFGT